MRTPVSLVAPAVRMLLLVAWAHVEDPDAEEHETYHEVYPVVALAAVPTGEGPHFEALVVDPIGGVVPASELRDANSARMLVACEWGVDDDARRLAGRLQTLTREAVENAVDDARRLARRGTPEHYRKPVLVAGR